MKNQTTERIIGYLFLPYLAQTKIESSFIEITIFFDMGGGKPPKIASSFINRMHSATFDRQEVDGEDHRFRNYLVIIIPFCITDS